MLQTAARNAIRQAHRVEMDTGPLRNVAELARIACGICSETTAKHP